jgi:hypothetical protein
VLTHNILPLTYRLCYEVGNKDEWKKEGSVNNVGMISLLLISLFFILSRPKVHPL